MDYEGKENYCESKIISKTDLRKVQGYQEKRICQKKSTMRSQRNVRKSVTETVLP